MDACIMSMPEVSDQMRADVVFNVDTEADKPDTGWPYDKILEN